MAVDKDPYIRRSDLKRELKVFGVQLKKEITTDLAEVIVDAMSNINNSFLQLDAKIDNLQTQVSEIRNDQVITNRRLDVTIGQVDDHSVRIKLLENMVLPESS